MTNEGNFHNVRWSGTGKGFAIVSMSAGDQIEHPLLGRLRVAEDGVYRISDDGVMRWGPAGTT